MPKPRLYVVDDPRPPAWVDGADPDRFATGLFRDPGRPVLGEPAFDELLRPRTHREDR